jgi:hypothetical protein
VRTNVIPLHTDRALAAAWDDYERTLRELNDDILHERGTSAERMAKAIALRGHFNRFTDLIERS